MHRMQRRLQHLPVSDCIKKRIIKNRAFALCEGPVFDYGYSISNSSRFRLKAPRQLAINQSSSGRCMSSRAFFV